MHLGDKPQAPLEVCADAVEAPAELGVAAGLAGATCVIAQVQLVAAAGHGWDAQVKLAQTHAETIRCKHPNIHMYRYVQY